MNTCRHVGLVINENSIEAGERARIFAKQKRRLDLQKKIEKIKN